MSLYTEAIKDLKYREILTGIRFKTASRTQWSTLHVLLTHVSNEEHVIHACVSVTV